MIILRQREKENQLLLVFDGRGEETGDGER